MRVDELAVFGGAQAVKGGRDAEIVQRAESVALFDRAQFLVEALDDLGKKRMLDRKSTRLNSSHRL